MLEFNASEKEANGNKILMDLLKREDFESETFYELPTDDI